MLMKAQSSDTAAVVAGTVLEPGVVAGTLEKGSAFNPLTDAVLPPQAARERDRTARAAIPEIRKLIFDMT